MDFKMDNNQNKSKNNSQNKTQDKAQNSCPAKDSKNKKDGGAQNAKN